jgi:hypothetical protein
MNTSTLGAAARLSHKCDSQPPPRGHAVNGESVLDRLVPSRRTATVCQAHQHRPIWRHGVASLRSPPAPSAETDTRKRRTPGALDVRRRGTANGPWSTASSAQEPAKTHRSHRADVRPPRRATSHPTRHSVTPKGGRASQCQPARPIRRNRPWSRPTTATASALRPKPNRGQLTTYGSLRRVSTRATHARTRTAGCSATPPVRFDTFRRDQLGDRHAGLPHRRHPLSGFLTLSAV